ncbi:MAG: tetratricopeptide repeat protein [Fibrobacterota bacterium]
MKVGKSVRFALAALLLGLCVSQGLAQSIESLMSSGNQYLQNGAYDQAATKYRTVLGRNPGHMEALFNLGLAYLNMGKNNQAVTEFKKALGSNPACTECWGNMAVAYQNLGQGDQALGALYKAVQTNPGNIEARVNLATMYATNDRLKDAVAQYKEIIQIDGRNIDAHLNLAKCLISLGHEDEAKGYLKSALPIDPNDPEIYWELGNIAWNKDKNAEEALKNYKKAVEIQPNSQVYYENLALLQEHLDQKEEAIKTWNAYLIYLDDALKKEHIRDRISRLEMGESATGKVAPEKLFGETSTIGIDRLRGELGRGEQKIDETQMIQTEAMDVSKELEGLSGDSEEGSMFEFDMNKEMKKRNGDE